VIHRACHLQEERLFDSYLAERAGEPLDPPVAEHLADCASCASRYAELSSFMDTLRRDGDAEADAIFTPERLRIQQQQILRRISLVGRPARVLSFPGRIVRRTIEASNARTAPRWIAAAAAAGLFVGVAVGASFQWRSQQQARQSFLTDAGRAQRLGPVATRGTGQPDVATDDAFLSDLELALERPHTRELQAFDALTPHLREIRDQR
jgi:predicted anti-sigma-YlaC factor YlaD